MTLWVVVVGDDIAGRQAPCPFLTMPQKYGLPELLPAVEELGVVRAPTILLPHTHNPLAQPQTWHNAACSHNPQLPLKPELKA